MHRSAPPATSASTAGNSTALLALNAVPASAWLTLIVTGGAPTPKATSPLIPRGTQSVASTVPSPSEPSPAKANGSSWQLTMPTTGAKYTPNTRFALRLSASGNNAASNDRYKSATGSSASRSRTSAAPPRGSLTTQSGTNGPPGRAAASTSAT